MLESAPPSINWKPAYTRFLGISLACAKDLAGTCVAKRRVGFKDLVARRPADVVSSMCSIFLSKPPLHSRGCSVSGYMERRFKEQESLGKRQRASANEKLIVTFNTHVSSCRQIGCATDRSRLIKPSVLL